MSTHPDAGAGRLLADGVADSGEATLVVDREGRVVMCGGAVRALTGRSAGELVGRPLHEATGHPSAWDAVLCAEDRDGPLEVTVRTPRGEAVRLHATAEALDGADGAGVLLRLETRARAEHRAQDDALLRALSRQQRVGLAIRDMDLKTIRVHVASQPPTERGVAFAPIGRGIEEVLIEQDAIAVRDQLRRVAATGEPVLDWEHRARRRSAPEEERALSMSVFRMESTRGVPTGVAVVFTEVTESYLARRRTELLHTVAERIGWSLDVRRVAEELADAVVGGGFADCAAVDLDRDLLGGTGPHDSAPSGVLERVAVADADGWRPPGTRPAGETFRGAAGEGAAAPGPLLDEARRAVVAPLSAGGHLLGVLRLWRGERSAMFARSDGELAEELASWAALALDNARRYQRERRTAEALQRSLLPREVTDTAAAQTVGRYIPADEGETGGTWYDVIPLSSARIAFVIGDVTGRGLAAVAATGRLRTAIQTLSDLDLSPSELLTHLDDLVNRLEAEASPAVGEAALVGSASPGRVTCLYCVYDPVTGRCEMASAAHPPPVMATPGGTVRDVPVRPGPHLGHGGVPCESVTFDVPAGALLAFRNRALTPPADGPGPQSDPASGAPLLAFHEALSEAARTGASPARAGRSIAERALPDTTADDVSLLIARPRRLPDTAVATWEFPADPEHVAAARELVQRQLTRWGLQEMFFTTELLVSELVTNAIRYGGGDRVGLRLIRDGDLVCEVSDTSQTQPRLRRARVVDEGGRGLFLVAQLSERWGCRYTPTGKTIWAAQTVRRGDDPAR